MVCRSLGGTEVAGVGGSHAEDADCIDGDSVDITGGTMRSPILITWSEDPPL
eukprot:CAMPEP_0172729730 /NCGR_PEP_ID=MMETSP1074-20121228/95740_1 /TAXON_ID=2916 /ORGANISM="Ceratium fusus, Strain PA161109" /LENGTH=51 /DNA_ID=CAMNT_0013557279 /DNA_START=282 /DNA_END=437 /DNA_ORIENTATION=+